MSYFFFVAECNKTPRGWQSTTYHQLESKILPLVSSWILQPTTITLDGIEICGCIVHDYASSDRLFETKKSSYSFSPGQKVLLSLQLDQSVETFFSMKWIHGVVSGFSAETKDAEELDIRNAVISEVELRTETLFFLRKKRKFGARWIKEHW
ncbi:MAG: hypothetical protein IPK50_09510 [Fibrobacterota bacterium]|nr:hypothetical protein [Fibrobacterota bacterium]QQS07115.1 MAG: hypothetical protein IPK50_09510 [Fibrobacterota bacterium]